MDKAERQADGATEAVFVFGSIARQRGGVTRVLLARIRLYTEAGFRVRLLLTEHTEREEAEEAELRETGALPTEVEVRYFWREAAPDGGGAPAHDRAPARREPGLTAFDEATGNRERVLFFDNGVLVKTKHFDDTGRLHRIDHHDIARRVVTRELFDPHCRLVRIDDVDARTGTRTARRFFDRSGAYWLSVQMNGDDGTSGAATRHRPAQTQYASFAHCVAEWVDEVLREADRPAVFSDVRSHDGIVVALGHPRVRKIAVLHNCHTASPYRSVDPPKQTWLPVLENLDQLDVVVMPTQSQRDHLAARYGVYNFRVINHPAPPPSPRRVRREPGVLVAVARLVSQKRLDHAVRAFAVAAQQVPDARFDIYGTGESRAKLRALAGKLGVADRVVFRGFTRHALDVLAGAAATVLSSRYEGWGLVLTEAMSVGTPAVAYDINYGPNEVIRHEVDGLLVEPGNIEELAEALVRVLGDHDYARSLGERAREVTQRFAESRWRQEWLSVLDTASTGGPSTGEPSTGEPGAGQAGRWTQAAGSAGTNGPRLAQHGPERDQ